MAASNIAWGSDTRITRTTPGKMSGDMRLSELHPGDQFMLHGKRYKYKVESILVRKAQTGQRGKRSNGRWVAVWVRGDDHLLVELADPHDPFSQPKNESDIPGIMETIEILIIEPM